MAWLLPLPRSVSDFVGQILRKDPLFAEEGVLSPEQCMYLPIVSFEIESASGKHAGGALLNLNAVSVLGVVISPDEATTRQVDATLRTDRPTLGLRNVFMKTVT